MNTAFGNPYLTHFKPAPIAVASKAHVPVFELTEKVNAEALRAIDPVFPEVFPLWSTPATPVTLTKDGAPIAVISPTDAGRKPASDLAIQAYEQLVLEHGTEDAGDVSGAWDDEGAAAMQAAMPDAEMCGAQLRVWRGEIESRLRQVEAIGRWYGMTPEAIEAVTGRPYVARRSMLPPCGMAKTLDERQRLADEVAARAQAAAEAAFAESQRPKSLAELRIDAVECAKSRSVMASEPFFGAQLLYETATGFVYGWRTILGLELPPFDVCGVRSLPQTSLAPLQTLPVPEPSPAALGFVKGMRAEHGKGYDLGPIARARFTDRGIPLARELAREHSSSYVAPGHLNAWRSLWLVEAVVRGCLVQPDLATKLLLEAFGEADMNRHPPMRMPTKFHMREVVLGREVDLNGRPVDPFYKGAARPETGYTVQQRFEPAANSAGEIDLGNLAAGFAARGEISVGVLIEVPSASPAHDKRRPSGSRQES